MGASFAMYPAGVCVNHSMEEITAVIRTFFLVWKKNVTSTPWCLGSAPEAPQRKSVCLLLEHLQRCAMTLTAALGPDVLGYFTQSGASWSQVTGFGGGYALDLSAIRVAGMVIALQTACGESGYCLLFPVGLPENWVEAAGKLLLARGVASACQEEPLTQMFSCQKEEVVISQLPGERQ